MDREIRLFIEQIENLYETNYNEILELFDNDGFIGCVEICSECGKNRIVETDINIPEGLNLETVRELLSDNFDVDISDETLEELQEHTNVCDCTFEDELKEPEGY